MAELCDYPTEELVEELEHRGIEVQPLIEHHTKYLEIDGYDETVWVTHKQHREIHREDRKNGRIIPDWICQKARSRTKKAVENRRRRFQSPHYKACSAKYQKENRHPIIFYEKISTNVFFP